MRNPQNAPEYAEIMISLLIAMQSATGTSSMGFFHEPDVITVKLSKTIIRYKIQRKVVFIYKIRFSRGVRSFIFCLLFSGEICNNKYRT